MSLTKLYPWNNPETSKYSKYLSFLLGVSTLMSLTEAALICHQCTWDNEHEIWENDIMSLKEILKELGGDSVAIDDPFTIPFLGKNFFPQEPTKNDLYRECFNCSTTGGACVKWSFSVSGSTLNITRLCARSTYKSGCYEQEIAGRIKKEVCLCNTDFCNSSTCFNTSSVLPLLLVLLVYKGFCCF